ncbi:hypothetical protein FD14_GL003024 [Secundilactobacillus similis DSM 23365 = JCM 2765]|uniref:Uncharacterized protein n=1 Tax=Secundilactobacillus similis DSM 23365 = JCM 2765 TaxID=1423804 RepID=A0A0R2FNM0_9LACO|nr:hypothetical protein FD14_GL003024 [Secundilactobacillus similis DSM 23365 = JCM 2765]
MMLTQYYLLQSLTAKSLKLAHIQQSMNYPNTLAWFSFLLNKRIVVVAVVAAANSYLM